MRAAAAVLLFWLAAGNAGAAGVHVVQASDAATLQAELLRLAAQRMHSEKLVLDERRASLAFPHPLPSAGTFEVLTLPAVSGRSLLPMEFELHYANPSSGAKESFRATLTAPLLQAVMVASRRIEKGDAVACDQLHRSLRPAYRAPRESLAPPCALGGEAVALRDLAAGDVVRSSDIGARPEVLSGDAVVLSVISNNVTVTTAATALGDARLDQSVRVRAVSSKRLLHARVTGPRAVRVVEASP